MSFTEAQETDRADEEAIYSNADIMNDGLRTGLEDSDAKGLRTLQCTGIQTHLIMIMNTNTQREHFQNCKLRFGNISFISVVFRT